MLSQPETPQPSTAKGILVMLLISMFQATALHMIQGVKLLLKTTLVVPILQISLLLWTMLVIPARFCYHPR